jgi:hypothetical protein
MPGICGGGAINRNRPCATVDIGLGLVRLIGYSVAPKMTGG